MKRLPAHRFILIVVWVLSAISAHADPIAVTNDEISKPAVILWLAVAFSLEAVCFIWVLRRFRKPHFFFVWLIGMHFVTYPAFLQLCLWLELQKGTPPVFAMGIGEILVMLFEGLLTYDLPLYSLRQVRSVRSALCKVFAGFAYWQSRLGIRFSHLPKLLR